MNKSRGRVEALRMITNSGIIIVSIGECALARSPVKIKTSGLGSCVGITLYDRQEKIGGLIHAVLPSIKNSQMKENPLKFTDSGIEYLMNKMVRKGSSRKKLEAKLAGGASMFENPHVSTGHTSIGERNTKQARETLKRLGISIVAEDTGKNYGRTITFDTSNGNLLIRTSLRRDIVI